MTFMKPSYNSLVGSIYDCAANPELWPSALGQIAETVGSAYALVGFINKDASQPGGVANWVRRNSAWDEEWLLRLEKMLHLISGGGGFHTPVDTAWTQLSVTPENEFHETEFYQHWVKPQGLRDTINVPFLQRHDMVGMWNLPSYATREPYGADDMRLCESLTPHIRRAMLINDLTDKGKLALALYRSALDQLSAAVFIVGQGRRVVFTNAAGEKLLAAGSFLKSTAGVLSARRVLGAPSALDDAIDRAAKGDTGIGISGIGVPLLGPDGERTAAYVLPISGKDLRGDLGRGHCAVFIAQRGGQQPMALEILRTLYDLTPAEARVALMVAQGDGPAAIAESLGLSVNTVRSHLARSFSKTGSGDQTALGALVNSLMPPIASSQ